MHLLKTVGIAHATADQIEAPIAQLDRAADF